MSLIALVSPGGAPGATTSTLALALTWPRPVLVAETNPGGSSVLPGFFGAHHSADRGVFQLALQFAQDPAGVEASLWSHTRALDASGSVRVLPGPADPYQASAISAAAWEMLAEVLSGQSCDVLADAGEVRAHDYPWPVLHRAEVIVMVLRPTLRQVAAAKPRLAVISEQAPGARLVLCVVGDGPHQAGEVRAALGEFHTVITLPADPKVASRLSDAVPTRRSLGTSRLVTAARPGAKALVQMVSSLRPQPLQGRR